MIRNVIIFLFILSVLMTSCARIGTPMGGPKDVTPPKMTKAYPDTFSKNVSKYLKEIRIDFDEYIVIKEPSKQIIISPISIKSPIIKPTENNPKKYISIKFMDTLQENTTYNINFGQSIADNNEGNKYPEFSYVFSTGNSIDSLKLGGNTKQALENIPNLKTVTALYHIDSLGFADFSKRPMYISKIDSSGNYNLNYLKTGKYELISFIDDNFNLKYEPTEPIGFLNNHLELDKDLNENLILSLNKQKPKILTTAQLPEGQVIIKLQGNPDSIQVSPINKELITQYYVYQKPRMDSAYIWINPDNFKDRKDRKIKLEFKVTNQTITDTVSIFYDTELKPKFKIQNTSKNVMMNQYISLNSNMPIDSINYQLISVKKDSIDIDFTTDFNPRNPFELDLKFPMEYDKKYSVTFNKDALKSYYGQKSDSLTFKFSTTKSSAYGQLKVTVSNAPTFPFFFQLMRGKEVIKEIYSTNSKFEFKNLDPGDYYFRILVDENKNGFWDSGDYYARKQPEPTFILSQNITVRAFWELNETWILK